MHTRDLENTLTHAEQMHAKKLQCTYRLTAGVKEEEDRKQCVV